MKYALQSSNQVFVLCFFLPQPDWRGTHGTAQHRVPAGVSVVASVWLSCSSRLSFSSSSASVATKKKESVCRLSPNEWLHAGVRGVRAALPAALPAGAFIMRSPCGFQHQNHYATLFMFATNTFPGNEPVASSGCSAQTFDSNGVREVWMYTCILVYVYMFVWKTGRRQKPSLLFADHAAISFADCVFIGPVR